MLTGSPILPEIIHPAVSDTRSNAIFWHYPHFSNQLGRLAGAVRAGDFKLVEDYETGKLALYNLFATWRKNINA